jgi:allantoate deiminase
MRMRQDALCAASEFVLEAQRYARRTKGLVATVGKMTVEPGASNVIPGRVALTLDVRHQDDAVRLAAVQHFQKGAAQWTTVGDTATVQCDGAQVARMRQAVRRQQGRVLEMVSGAGHDAAMMARLAPVAMLFVRCKNGVSHHPDEAVAEDDLRVALAVFSDYIHEFV